MSKRENSKKLLDNYLKENLLDIKNENFNHNLYQEYNENFKVDQQTTKKNENKSYTKVPEIKIENNNATKNDLRFEMPEINKSSYNDLNNFHDNKRKIEGIDFKFFFVLK